VRDSAGDSAYFTHLIRLAATALFAVTLSPAWVMSVEFPFTNLPRPNWERDLAHLKEMGVVHVSLPAASDDAQLDEVIRIVRRLGLEADLEGPLPARLQPLARSHGGPLTDELAQAVRIAATMPRAIDNERKLLTGGTQAIIWTDAFESLIPAPRAGAITLAGNETPAAALIRREAQLTRYWGTVLPSLQELPGARLAVPEPGISVHQYVAGKGSSLPSGLSMVAIFNTTDNAWKGDAAVMYPVLQRPISLPSVAIAPGDAVWLPVNIPLDPGPLCAGCSSFAPPDHLAYATAELTGMEYENGILAMEFMAHSPGEVVLQLSHEPTGPLVAAGKPTVFDWDSKTQRARLPIPAGGATGRVRIALAIDAPPATAFFEGASVLLIGETNRLAAQFSPAAVAGRSRLRVTPELPSEQEVAIPENKDEPARVSYKITVPATAVAGDTALLSIEADGAQMSHSRLRLLPPVTVTFPEAVAVRVAAGSNVTVAPLTIAVNQRTGREIVLSIRNNAAEIRTFELTLNVPGLEFSPEKVTVSVGASLSRDLTFRVFSSSAAAGLHAGTLTVSGGAAFTEAVRFVVLPPDSSVAWSAGEFSLLESTKLRASFAAGRWLEMVNKDTGADSQPPGGTPFNRGPVETLRLEDLERPAPPK
jgi:hypothetical protein